MHDPASRPVNPARGAAPDLRRLQRAARRATTTLQAIANENRLLLLCQLAQGEAAVAELEQGLGIRQPTLSQQLGVLRAEGLVATRREGRRIFYRVADPKVHAILETLYGLFCPPARAGRKRESSGGS